MATFEVATAFVAPPNPGVYPAGPFPAGSKKEREAEHKKEIAVYETYLGVAEGLKALIRQAVDEDYILELRAEKIGYLWPDLSKTDSKNEPNTRNTSTLPPHARTAKRNIQIAPMISVGNWMQMLHHVLLGGSQ